MATETEIRGEYCSHIFRCDCCAHPNGGGLVRLRVPAKLTPAAVLARLRRRGWRTVYVGGSMGSLHHCPKCLAALGARERMERSGCPRKN